MQRAQDKIGQMQARTGAMDELLRERGAHRPVHPVDNIQAQLDKACHERGGRLRLCRLTKAELGTPAVPPAALEGGEATPAPATRPAPAPAPRRRPRPHPQPPRRGHSYGASTHPSRAGGHGPRDRHRHRRAAGPLPVGAFNGLVKRRNRTQEAWSEIDIELKRRHDLIPNLVSTVQGYAAHEQGTFEAVTQARADAVTAGATGDPTKIGPAENALSGSAALPVRRRRELPAAPGRRELPAAPGDPDGDRGQDRVRAPLLQHQRPGLQHSLQTFPRNLIAGPFGFKAVAFFRPTRRTGRCPRSASPDPAARRTGPPASGHRAGARRRRTGGPGRRQRPARRPPPRRSLKQPTAAGRAQTDCPEAIFSRAAIRCSIGGWVS